MRKYLFIEHHDCVYIASQVANWTVKLALAQIYSTLSPNGYPGCTDTPKILTAAEAIMSSGCRFVAICLIIH